jgi:predicted DNA-binding transcriptional regulator YafY
MNQRTVTFIYKNHRGEVGKRNVQPISMRYQATQWHPEPQWLLEAYDNEKEAVRLFAMSDIKDWSGPKPKTEGKKKPG